LFFEKVKKKMFITSKFNKLQSQQMVSGITFEFFFFMCKKEKFYNRQNAICE